MADAKDPNDYLRHLSGASAAQLVSSATHLPELAVLANAFGVSAEDTLNNSVWDAAPRARRFRAFIYEASLWRVGIAISDYLGLHDDVAKFSSAELYCACRRASIANKFNEKKAYSEIE